MIKNIDLAKIFECNSIPSRCETISEKESVAMNEKVIEFKCNPEFEEDTLYPNITAQFSNPQARSDLSGILGYAQLNVDGEKVADPEDLGFNLLSEVNAPFDIFTCFEHSDQSSNLSVNGRVEIFDFSAASKDDIIARTGQSISLSLGDLNAKIEVVRYEEDEDGDEEGVWYLTADVSECDGEKFALRVGFEDGLYSADWDFADLLAEHEDKDDLRELCVYGVEEGDLLTVELRIAEKTSLSEEFSIKI